MKPNLIIYVFMSIVSVTGRVLLAQDTIVARNKVKPMIDITIQRETTKLRYRFTIGNSPESQQSIWQFWLISNQGIDIEHMTQPTKWRGSVVEDEDSRIVNWGSPGENDISPGRTLAGFSFLSTGIPGMILYYSEGYSPPPSFPPGMAQDSIPGYDDLTPYGPGVVGKTVGPVLPPSPFAAVGFLDTLVSYKHRAADLGWIINKGIINSLDQKLENARKQLEQGNTKTAKNLLEAFVNEVEALNKKGKQLTSEAYALLKFNAEYLISKL